MQVHLQRLQELTIQQTGWREASQDGAEAAEEAAFDAGKPLKRVRKQICVPKQKPVGSSSEQTHLKSQAPSVSAAPKAAVEEAARPVQKVADTNTQNASNLGEASAHRRSLQDLMAHAPQSPVHRLPMYVFPRPYLGLA